MEIHDFLPKYPNINKSEERILNPYDDGFYETIFKKKEFYEERLSETEDIPSEKGMKMKHQKIISRFMSSYTIYDELLLVAVMGTGKTCTAIGVIEHIKNTDNNYVGALIFAKGPGLLTNFVTELRDKCTGGQYMPEGYKADTTESEGKKRGLQLTTRQVKTQTKKLYEEFYTFNTFSTFAKQLNKMSDKEVIYKYSNHVIVIDEVHNLRVKDVTDGDNINMYFQFHRFLHLIKNCKKLLLSGTPMNSYFYLSKYEFFLIKK